jgi:sulfite exporter TauE/SafE
MALYLLGKTVTYASLGLILGMIGASAMSFSGVQRGLSIAMGAALILIGLAAARVIPDRALGGFSAEVGRRLGPALGRANRSGPLVLGLLNGIIPCGLVYAALAHAAQSGSAALGAIGMAVFGLGTMPALLLAGLVGRRVAQATRLRVAKLGGWLVVAFGIWVIVRTLMRGMHPMA